jgi:1-deoxy-D-xylulose-5-phosphate reductoisomerase
MAMDMTGWHAPSAERPRGVTILGSTGSVGQSTVDLIARDPESYRVEALVAGNSVEALAEQARRLRARVAVVANEQRYRALKDALVGTSIEAAAGPTAVIEAAARPAEWVMAAVVGFAGLESTLVAARRGAMVALANKETLVCAGRLLIEAIAESGGALLPVDSEHNAIFQVLEPRHRHAIDRLILTASGGPFLDTPAEAFAAITPEQALQHPTWRMGAKVTIDSATRANKGLEVIEARWLYDVGYEQIDVVIHPQSVVHSAVQFVDGSLKAQLGTPDMRLPIQYALTHPDRRPSPAAAADLLATARLDFRAPDEARFPALRIAREAGRLGPRATTALIAADDVAVARFLEGSLDFPGIPRLLEATVARFGTAGAADPDLDEVLALDAEVRSNLGSVPSGAGA